MPGPSKLLLVTTAKTRALAIRFGQIVGEPHHAGRIVAVREAERVPELVDRFRRRPLPKERSAQSGEREDGDAPARVSFPEHEIEIRDVEVHVGDAQETLPFRALRA